MSGHREVSEDSTSSPIEKSWCWVLGSCPIKADSNERQRWIALCLLSLSKERSLVRTGGGSLLVLPNRIVPQSRPKIATWKFSEFSVLISTRELRARKFSQTHQFFFLKIVKKLCWYGGYFLAFNLEKWPLFSSSVKTLKFQRFNFLNFIESLKSSKIKTKKILKRGCFLRIKSCTVKSNVLRIKQMKSSSDWKIGLYFSHSIVLDL